jgi:hypothetical protein
MKILLNNKLEKLEQEQRMQYENLKRSIEQGDGLKMMGADKNSNGGNIYDLKRAEEEDMINTTRKLPRLLEEKLNIINNMKRKEKEDEKRLLSQVRNKVNEELKKQKEKDEIKFKKEMEEIEQKRENIRQEKKRLMEELQNNKIAQQDILHPKPQNRIYPPQNYPQYPYNPSFFPPPYLMNNKNDSTSEFLKIFLLKKLFDDEKPQQIMQNPPMPQYIPTPIPQMPQMPQIQYQPPPQIIPQQQPIPIPQPIIIQSPPQNVGPPNIIIQKDRSPPPTQIIQQPNVGYKDIVLNKTKTISK